MIELKILVDDIDYNSLTELLVPLLAEKLEKDGKGLNLCWEVRNGIITHTKGAWARTMEGCTVRYADHIAFLNHDIEAVSYTHLTLPTT